MNACPPPSVKRRIGRPPLFNGGFSRTAVRLKLSRAQWDAIEAEAERQGRSFREFLKMRLKAALKDVLETES
jgi:hypothetical protein